MTFASGTINSTNAAADTYAAIATTLATAGFTLHDTVVISTRTHRIHKCAAANNSAGLDWYIDIAYETTGGTYLWFMVMEFFDPATDLGFRLPYVEVNGTFDATTYSRWGPTGQTLESTNLGVFRIVNGPSMTNYICILSASAFGYWLSATGDRIILLTSSDATFLQYHGLYTPNALHVAAAGASLYPLVSTKINSNGTAQSSTTLASLSGGFTRLPKVASFGSSQWSQQYRAEAIYGNSSPTPRIPDGAITMLSQRALSPIIIGPGDAVGGLELSGPFGSLKDLGKARYGSGVARGDTLTVDGATWVTATQVSNAGLAFKAA